MRNEYPRPQFARDEWLCLNGPWEFTADPGNSGLDRELWLAPSLGGRINVPFCPESALSGVNEPDFMLCVWYARNFILPPSMRGKRILLHFEAADFETGVWCNGKFAGRHRGGYTPFTFDITELINEEGENRLAVRCFDDVRSGKQAVGKQSGRFFSAGCHYSRTTGIWQTVWLEAVPDLYIQRVRYAVDIEKPAVTVTMELSGYAEHVPARVETSFEGRVTGCAELTVTGSRAVAHISLTEKHLWECGNGRLYDVRFEVGNDHTTGYFGLRTIDLEGKRILLNGKPVFQKLILDQGFYPDGIYTAPSDDALVKDIELSIAAGFNGARMHQKIFERRFLHYADRMGYLVWGEYPSWGLDIRTPGVGLSVMLPEWLEAVERDINSPSLVGWCPLNETFDGQDESLLYALYQATKALDPTRPVIDTSGYVHVITDIWDVHDYDQNPETFATRYSVEAIRAFGSKPFFMSEYGGIWWNKQDPNGWGYGERVKDEEAFYTRLEGLTDALLGNPDITAFCYTQLTDVEQEQNGIYHYDRSRKFDMARIKRIFGKEAAIEKT